MVFGLFARKLDPSSNTQLHTSTPSTSPSISHTKPPSSSPQPNSHSPEPEPESQPEVIDPTALYDLIRSVPPQTFHHHHRPPHTHSPSSPVSPATNPRHPNSIACAATYPSIFQTWTHLAASMIRAHLLITWRIRRCGAAVREIRPSMTITVPCASVGCHSRKCKHSVSVSASIITRKKENAKAVDNPSPRSATSATRF
ncbi:uncharacterized protein EDB91DRAFT_217100 [Suillus paluster]|uniref:uncharacterized protein n=1 Tax=Suillus paluster TaxID=48578 RepID=UPI001B868DBB|nr:uncharacterized protein EDB91DRAFT_217100 [Suillus paluster]KAG1743556.1 hypothetical protein EDB91DRAFT_217100 [Suillus paluster]